MSSYVDSSVLIAAIIESEAFHRECVDLLDDGSLHVRGHGLTEVFGVLTGGRLGFRVPALLAAELIEESLVPSVKVVAVPFGDILCAFREADARGVRGGAVYDYLHLVAARRAKAERIYTLNVSDFRAFHRRGDPEIAHP